MTAAITRNQQKMSFAYDTTCQLTAEHGTYLSFERQTSNVECQCAYTYTAFGAPVSGITNPASCILRSSFSSKEHDTQSGLSYYGFRYYDPHSARWMNKEPSGADGPNLYLFVHSTPLHLLDYRGRDAYDHYAYYNSGAQFGPPPGRYNGGEPSVLDNLLDPIGPPANTYMHQERYFEKRWSGWTRFALEYYRKRVNAWIESHCGCSPYNEKPEPRDISVHRSSASDHGDAPMTSYERYLQIGSFAYEIERPFAIRYSGTNRIKSHTWSAYVYVADYPGLNSLSTSITPDRFVRRAQWRIHGSGVCKQ